MEGWDPLTGTMRAPRPGESLIAGPPETSPRQPRPPQRSGPKGLFHQFTEDERDDLLRKIGRAWSGPLPEEEQLPEEDQQDQVLEEEMRSLIRDALLREGGLSPGLQRNAMQLDVVSEEYGWDRQQELDAMMAMEALAADGDLMYEDMAFAGYIDDEDRPLAVAFEVNAAGAFDEDEVGLYHPETGETEYFTREDFDDYMGYNDQPSAPTHPYDLEQYYSTDELEEIQRRVSNLRSKKIEYLGE
jgi:hypothetical protein